MCRAALALRVETEWSCVAVECEVWGGLWPQWQLSMRFGVDYGRDGGWL
jgi:hypothetical protein